MSEPVEGKVIPGLFLLARTGSSRLAAKALRLVQGKPVIEHLIERLRTAGLPSVFVLATTTMPEDDVLQEVATRCGIACFRGAVNDVVERMLRGSEHFGLDCIACVGGDDVFCDGELVDAVIAEYARNEVDFITVAGVPFGVSPFGVSVSGLRHVLKIKEGEFADGWERYFTQTGLFRTSTVHLSDPALNHPDLRLDLDYPEDLDLLTAVYDRLYHPGHQPSLKEVVRLLVDEEPSLALINRAAHERWLQTRAEMPLNLKPGFRDLTTIGD